MRHERRKRYVVLRRLRRFFAVCIVIAVVFLVQAVTSGYFSEGRAEAPSGLTVQKIGFIGDSITVGSSASAVQSEMNALGEEYVAINRGVNGSTTEDWLPGRTNFDSSKTVFQSANVKVVSIMLGTNDALRGITRSDKYESNMRTILESLLSGEGIECIIVNYPIYLKSEVPQITDDMKAYRNALDRIVNGKNILKGDTRAYEYFATHPDELSDDGVHPKDKGYESLGKLWAVAAAGIVKDAKCSAINSPSNNEMNGS